jgi:hypothetical protein
VRTGHGGASASRRIAVFATLLAIVAGGFVLRLRGIGHLLPTITQLDAATIVGQVEELRSMRAGEEDRVRTRYYPLLLARAASCLPAPPPPEAGAPADVDEHLRRASAAWVQVRRTSIVLSMLLVPLTWLFARRFLGSVWAVLPAALVATSLLHVSFSAQERPHGTAASFMLLAVLASMRLRRDSGFASYLLAGAAAGLAVAALHYGAFVVFALLGAVVLLLRDDRRRIVRHVAGTFLALLVVAAFFRWSYPFYFEPSSGLLQLEQAKGEVALNLSGQPLLLERFRGSGFPAMVSNLLSYDPVILVAALLGGALLASRLRRGGWRALDADLRGDVLVACSFLVPYLVVIGMYDESWERFLLAILPYLATAGGYGVKRIAEAAASRARSAIGRSVVAPALAGLAPALALIPALCLGRDRSAPDTLRCASRWIREHVAAEDPIVVVPYVDLPILDGDTAMANNAKRPWGSNWTRYQMRLSPGQKLGPRNEVYLFPGVRLEAKKALEVDPIGYFRSFGAKYVLLGATDNEELPWWRAREIMLGENRLVFRITCANVDDGSNAGLMQRFTLNPLRMPFFWFVIRSARMGPVLEIFRLD